MLAVWMAVQAATVPVASVEDDLRCTAVLASELETTRSDAGRTSITTAMLYFVGRIEGASPTTDIPAAVDRIKQAPISDVAAGRIRLQCAMRLLARTKTFAALDPNVVGVEEAR